MHIRKSFWFLSHSLRYSQNDMCEYASLREEEEFIYSVNHCYLYKYTYFFISYVIILDQGQSEQVTRVKNTDISGMRFDYETVIQFS